jgi:hypothetical protein
VLKVACCDCRSFQTNLDYYRMLSKVHPRAEKLGVDNVSVILSIVSSG